MTDILSSQRGRAENGKGNGKSHLCLFVSVDMKGGNVYVSIAGPEPIFQAVAVSREMISSYSKQRCEKSSLHLSTSCHPSFISLISGFLSLYFRL